MKKVISLTLFCFLFYIHKAQTFYTVHTPTILAQNALDVKIITKVAFGNHGLPINHSISVDNINKQIDLVSCYYYNPVLPSAPVYINTLTVGALSEGNYNLNYTVFITYLSTTVCATPNDTTTNSYSFYVGPTSNQELFIDNNFHVYPNPIKDLFKVITADNSSMSKVEILNILGEKVLEIYDHTSNYYIDISTLAKGFYLVNIYTDNFSFSKKIIKE